MAECQQEFEYLSTSVQLLTSSLSTRRLRQFKGTKDSGNQAFENYLWNARLSKALRFPLEIAEISLRNRVDQQLIDRFGSQWPFSDDFRDTAAPKTVIKLKETIERLRDNPSMARIVDELSFGFWTAMLSGRFVEKLWRDRLDVAFPNIPKAHRNGTIEQQAAHVYLVAKQVKDLRNDISHLKPIYRSDLSEKHGQIIHLIRLGCKTTADWTNKHSTLVKELRLGAGSTTRVALSKAWTQFQVLPSESKINEVISILESGPRPFLIVSHNGSHYLISPAIIASWLSKNVEPGLIDVEQEVSVMIEGDNPTAFLSRRATAWEARQFLSSSGQAARYARYAAIITETGASNEKPLGIIELSDIV
jgi:hypothetical protein